MNFQEKSTILMALALTVVYGVYFAVIWRWHGEAPVDEIVYQPLMVAAVAPLIILATLGHVIIAVLDPKEAGTEDERDRQIALHGAHVGGGMLGVAVFSGIVLAMLGAASFYVANALMLGWVLAELAERLTMIVLHRRGH